MLQQLKDKSCNQLILTGSVFEGKEGAGSENLRAFSPYALSKSFTAESFEYFCNSFNIHFGKFTIPNPFGAFEEPRFLNYLIKSWLQDQVPAIQTPYYIRDNIHVSLLAKAYGHMAQKSQSTRPIYKFNPSGYVERQGDFARRVGQALQTRISKKCECSFVAKQEFKEPTIRINTDPVHTKFPQWNEEQAWDSLAEYYLQKELVLT